MIIIAPFAQKLRNGKPNPKDYPYWSELLSKVTEPVIQVGVTGEPQLVTDYRFNLSLAELRDLVLDCRTWIGVDSFFQHFCWDLGKPGIVLWAQSDPKIFGHPENINLLKSRSYLRPNQFLIWEQAEYNAEAFVTPDIVLKELYK